MTTVSSSYLGPRSEPAGGPVPADRPYARSRQVKTDADLLSLLPSGDDALTWVQHGDGLVGWGTAARFSPAGPDRFADAAGWWQRFTSAAEVYDEVGVPGSGLVAFVSMAFADDPGDSVLIVPEVIVGRRNGVTWVTEISVGRPSRAVGAMHPVRPVRTPSAVSYATGQLSVTGYRAAVAEAVGRLRAGELGKVVLAHDLVATVPTEDGPVDPRYLLHGLADRYPNCWVFAVDGLVGATPELLLRRSGDTVSARVLAGTAWPRDDMDADALAASLLHSTKNREEHRYAVESLAATLQPFCATLTVPAEPVVLGLRNVVHLATEVDGRLAEDVSLLTLIGATHPTAAVGGTPRAAAVGLITELEGMDRGRYSGPVGWIDSGGDGEFGIALRCAQVSGNTVRLFAGCGIMADSDPDSEVAEAAAKFVPMRDALESVREP